MTPCARALLRAVAWFDGAEYAPTALELWRWLGVPETYGAVARTLAEDEEIQSRLATRDGFWMLRGRENLARERLQRARIAERKLRRARRAAAWIGIIPGVRFVAVANTLALAVSRDDSDIDVFIITRPGWLWTVRAAVAFGLRAFSLRPDEARRDAICASFFISEDALDISSLQISNDVYLPYWIATLRPLIVCSDVYDRFWSANSWIRDVLPNAWPRQVDRSGRGLVTSTIPVLERFLRRMQERRFPAAIRELMNRDTRVVISDRVLKFHTNDRRAEFRDRWQGTCRKIGVAV